MGHYHIGGNTVKRRGNRRYYQHHEVLLIRRIRELLYGQGFTIAGARNRLANPRHVDEADTAVRISANDMTTIRTDLESIIQDLDNLLKA